ncbi:MAG TPA: hypothetical protein VKA37_01275, partial [Halobacteriales archaeon]|nr:hypothetical protein [Halobacteriales archaeon]
HEVDQYSMIGGYIRGQQVQTLTSISPSGWNWEAAGPIASQIEGSRGQIVSLGQGSGQYVYNSRVESRVKTYERVEGATLTGTVPGAQNGTPVVAYVQLQTHTGRSFTYIQQTLTDPDGSFAMTVPYATDDSVGVADGGTNSSVRATGEYTIQAGTAGTPAASGSAAVPETAIYEGSDVQVTLEPVQQGNESTSSGNESTDDGDGSGDQSSGTGGESNTTGNGTAGSLVADRRLLPVEP